MTSAPDMRPRILLVDDEGLVIQSLCRLLSRLAPEFAYDFATSGEAALEKLETGTWFCVISDLRMPYMDGLQLLETVARTKPNVCRVMMSGTAEAQAATRALSVAHRFLCKPASARTVAECCRQLHRYVGLTGVDVAGIVAFAVASDVVARARNARTEATLSRLVTSDPALSMAVLHAVGSEFLGTRTQAFTVDEALRFLGKPGFEGVLASQTLLIVNHDDPHVVAHVDRASSRAKAVERRGGSPLDVLAALLVDIDRLGTGDPQQWTGLRARARGGDAAVLGMWGAMPVLVDQVTRFEVVPGRRSLRAGAAARAG